MAKSGVFSCDGCWHVKPTVPQIADVTEKLHLHLVQKGQSPPSRSASTLTCRKSPNGQRSALRRASLGDADSMGGHTRIPLAPIALLVVNPVIGSREDRQRRHLAGFDGLRTGSMGQDTLERRRVGLGWPPEARFSRFAGFNSRKRA